MTWKRILIASLAALMVGGLALWWLSARRDAAVNSAGQRVQELYKAQEYASNDTSIPA